jgi:hypothetical protein
MSAQRRSVRMARGLPPPPGGPPCSFSALLQRPYSATESPLTDRNEVEMPNRIKRVLILAAPVACFCDERPMDQTVRRYR